MGILRVTTRKDVSRDDTVRPQSNYLNVSRYLPLGTRYHTISGRFMTICRLGHPIDKNLLSTINKNAY